MAEASETSVKITVRRCPHCDNMRELSQRATFTQALNYEEEKITWYCTWNLLQCPACEKVTLEETSYDEFDYPIYEEEDVLTDDENGDLVYGGKRLYRIDTSPPITRKILYPVEPTPTFIKFNGVPLGIIIEYEEALQLREVSPNACAVLIRRTMEGICQYEKAGGKDLNAKIQALATSGRIPQTLADMAHLTRKIGNIGAHVVGDRVTINDVTTMIDFLEAILEYLYVAPAKIAAVQARLKKIP